MIVRLLLLLGMPVMAYFAVVSVSRRFNFNQRQTRLLFFIVLALLVVGILILLGRLPVQFILAPLGVAATFLLRILPSLMRLLPMWQMFRSKASTASPRPQGAVSTIKTQFLVMELAHDTGEMDGTVVSGEHKDKKLSALALPTLLALREECSQDLDSLQVLEAYLDRNYEDWRVGASDPEGDHRVDTGEMSRQLAIEILGLTGDESKEEIIKAHRALMQKLHPDRGGSDYLATKINLAKEALLKDE